MVVVVASKIRLARLTTHSLDVQKAKFEHRKPIAFREVKDFHFLLLKN